MLLQKIKQMGQQINSDYNNKEPVLIGVMNGAFMFMSDLLKEIDIPVEVDFISVSSYQGASSGEIRIISDLSIDITDRDIILVEDIVDTGQTLKFLIDKLKAFKPRSLAVCALLNKQEYRAFDVSITYLGFNIPNVFAVGYGLDHSNKFRNLNYIGVFDGK
jgi:hypoxanthine phosphoribosyltransferase